MEDTIVSVWNQILDCLDTGVFPPRKSKLCNWCSFQSICPEFGGEVLPINEAGVEKLRKVQV